MRDMNIPAALRARFTPKKLMLAIVLIAAALALLPRGRQATSLILLEIGDRERAKSFLAGAGRSRIALYRNTEVRLYKTLAAAFIGDFLAIGRAENVRASLDARAGRALAEEQLFRDV